MRQHKVRTWLIGTGLLALAAAPRFAPDDLVRRGNAAFEHGQFEEALGLYVEAEERTTDPGLVAFNKATALYRLGKYRDAELDYRRCREDAAGARLARLLYGLGNCLLQQAADSDPARIDPAIQCFQQALNHEDADDALKADARHNLELAILLRLKGENPAKNGETSSSAKPGVNDSPRDAQGRPPRAKSMGPADERHDPKHQQANATGTEAARREALTGQGNLPPVPDDDALVRLSPEDAAEQIRQAVERIAREWREHRQKQAAPVSRAVRDW